MLEHSNFLLLLGCSEALTAHFGKYGTIIDSVIMKDRATGHPRGFGFVTFQDPSICDRVFQDTHVIDGRTVSQLFFIRYLRSTDYDAWVVVK